MQEIIYYNIGDIVLKIISDLPYQLPDGNAEDFRIEPAQEDYTYIFQKTDDITNYLKNVSLISDVGWARELINKEGDYIRAFLWKNQFFDAVVQLEKKQGKIIYISPDILAERSQKGFNFLNYFCLERILPFFGGLVLHSSHIEVYQKAILFSAPSGTGKSTQADLWQQYAQAKIINGDRTLLRKKDNKWYAFGCPMCGTSQIHLQGSEPLYAIVMLEQGKRNDLERLKPMEAFSLMYSQITIPDWDRELILKNMELLEDIVQNIPVWKYSCTKTPDAVEVLKKALNIPL